MPKVSVVIPTYQSVLFVREAIDSVLAQTYKDFEIIVVDGGSTDGTREVLDSYGNSIQVVSQNGKGISNARNIGVLASKGDCIAFVDSDDLWLPNKLENQVRFLIEKPSSVGLIYSDAFLFPEDDFGRPSYLANKRAFQVGKPHRGKALKHLFRENFIPASTVMVRKLCFEEVGPFDESLILCEDIDMWMRIAACFEIDYQNKVLTKIRLHKGSVSHNQELISLSQIALRKKIAKTMPHLLRGLDPKSINRIYHNAPARLRLGVEYLLRGETGNAQREFRQYITLCPLNIIAYSLLLLTSFPFSLGARLEIRRYVPRRLLQRVYNRFVI